MASEEYDTAKQIKATIESLRAADQVEGYSCLKANSPESGIDDLESEETGTVRPQRELESQISKLKAEKAAAVALEDYDATKQIKATIESLRATDQVEGVL